MADYTAIVEAGEALIELLRDGMTPEPISNRELISMCSPHESENNQLTVYLFHMEDDRQGGQDGYYQYSNDVQKRRASQFNLSFLITAHSKAPSHMKEADRYRMIGALVQVIKDNPVLPRELLRGSLADTGAELHLSVERPNFEQMIKIWNNTSSPYKLSIVCKIAGVSIDSKLTRTVRRVVDVAIDVNTKPAGNG